MLLKNVDDAVAHFVVEFDAVFLIHEGVVPGNFLLHEGYFFTHLDRLVEVDVDCSEIHCENLDSFYDSAKRLLNLILSSKLIRERFAFKGSGVVDGHGNKGDLFHLLVKEAVSKDLQNSELWTEHLVGATARTFNKKLQNDFILHQLMHVASEDGLVEGIASESTAHEEGTRHTQNVGDTGDHHKVLSRADMRHLHVVVVEHT